MNLNTFLRGALFGLAFATIGSVPGTAFAQETAKPGIQSNEIHVIGRMALSLTPQERGHFFHLTKILFASTRELDRPILYTCNEDVQVPGSFVWDEIWSSKSALDRHLASPHFKTWWSWVQPHLSGKLKVEFVQQSYLKTL